MCALADTLILDEDGVYDPASFNDRLLLGLKGTMSEAELHVIKARLRGGILNKARRGEFRCPLPTGMVYDHSGNVTLDPDIQVRETIAHFFETFLRRRIRFPDRQGLSSGRHSLSLPLPRQPDGFPATDAFDGDARAAQSTLRRAMPMAAVAIGERSMAKSSCANKVVTTGRHVFQMLIPATSVGSSIRRT
ncbi:hypothetical protein [Rhizobium sp. K7/93]